ncbi:methyltransferase domain-containing protein [Actinomycetospora termitidis]|uniref:Methyltransferase domain-containing protein n=1 Tax=Actinomycetospora termitidis TaxID=3053470 RepID=A0ABT7MDH7_9PSEU|nr:methyltransferase domain-containing protein [Actinomycetospora sp. Odt1-22]MDL5158715.1 methyltransferase domain-containing protein [Actinomycetospora sp. Odt1-22]
MTAYSQGHAASVLRSQTWRTVANSAAYLAPHLSSGMRVLDVGCGPGTITADLATRVHSVLGVDTDPGVVEKARALGVDAVVGDAYALPDGPFDVVHAHQVLLHLTDPVAALREMLRVTRPGGLVAARDCDYGGIVLHPHDLRLDRWLEIYRGVARAHGTEPDAGRRLLGWAHAAGATDVTPSASIWCHATPDERAWWGGQWAERIVDSTIAERAVDGGFATRAELADIADAWRAWADHPDGWFSLPHGEVLIRVS